MAVGTFVSALATGALYVRLPDWGRVVHWLLGHLLPAGGGEALLVGGALLLALPVGLWRACSPRLRSPRPA